MKRILVLASAIFLAFTSISNAAAEKEWTFLLFLNGYNNLDSFGTLNLNQLEQVGSSDQVNFVVQWASSANRTTKRLLIQKDNDQARVTSPVLQDIGRVDMGDHRTLEEFLRWGISNYPAKHYFVAVWNHGSGWRNLRLKADGIHVSDISFDDNTGHAITTKQLGQVMNNVSNWLGRKIDIYGSDACLMGMVEIAAEMSQGVNYFVGSQDLEPGEGWPYHTVFGPLVANPQMSPRELSAHLTEEYNKAYTGGVYGNNEITMSAVDLGKLSALNQAVTKLGEEIRRMSNANRSKVFVAAKAAQDFDYSDYVDLGDFMGKIAAQNMREIDGSVLNEVSTALRDYVVLSRATDQFKGATGVSIWIPKDTGTLNRHLSKYRALSFETDTRWSEALSAFVGK